MQVVGGLVVFCVKFLYVYLSTVTGRALREPENRRFFACDRCPPFTSHPMSMRCCVPSRKSVGRVPVMFIFRKKSHNCHCLLSN